MSLALITGSTGLVGSESVNFFHDKGFDIIGIDNNLRKFFFCPGDWIFFAPIPEGLSTYQALNDLSKEIR